MTHSRRDFIKAGSASVVCGSALLNSVPSFAATLNVPLGLQLYSVRDLLPKDYQGTLKQIGALGFREVESAGYYKHSASEVKQAMSDAKLNLVSAHYSLNDLQKQFDQILAFNKEIGVRYIICSFPGFKDPSRLKGMKGQDILHAFTSEDWRWNAEQFNILGEKVSAAGMKFGYHNHTMEFRALEGVVPYDELMHQTDPTKVTMEMDCGWVIVGGGDPIQYLRKYPQRITMLHVKDFKKLDPSTPDVEPVVEEMGLGSIDYAPIFNEAAKAGKIVHCFAEQEAFNVPPMESLKIDADYLRKLGIK